MGLARDPTSDGGCLKTLKPENICSQLRFRAESGLWPEFWYKLESKVRTNIGYYLNHKLKIELWFPLDLRLGTEVEFQLLEDT